MSVESPNKVTSFRQLRKGISIYKTGRSPFWMLRLRDPYEGRYIVRSTKEVSRVDAFILHVPPETLDEDVVDAASFAVIEIRVLTRFSRSVQVKEVNCDP